MGAVLQLNARKHGHRRMCLPPAEALLWGELSKLTSLGFQRDAIIGNHIYTFACRSSKILLEIDAPPRHTWSNDELDRNREAAARGFLIIGVRSSDIYRCPEAVREQLASVAASRRNPELFHRRRRIAA